MAVPRNRHSDARTAKKRSHMAKKKKSFSTCTNCKEPTLTHRICGACGFYDKKSMITKKSK